MQRHMAVLCVVLAVLFSTVAAVHVHLNVSGTAPEHCLLCLAAHCPTLLAPPIALAPTETGVRGTIALLATNPYDHGLLSAFFIRPPPSAV